MNLRRDFTNEEHEQHCEIADCWHDAIIDLGKRTAQGWCDRCRAVAFDGATADEVTSRYGAGPRTPWSPAEKAVRS